MLVEVQPKNFLLPLLCKKLTEVGKCQQLTKLKILKSTSISFVKVILFLKATTKNFNLLALVPKTEFRQLLQIFEKEVEIMVRPQKVKVVVQQVLESILFYRSF